MTYEEVKLAKKKKLNVFITGKHHKIPRLYVFKIKTVIKIDGDYWVYPFYHTKGKHKDQFVHISFLEFVDDDLRILPLAINKIRNELGLLEEDEPF